ncbi:hypothetical protein J2S43_003234 [Catenuloplanes nepalensis]|uniref:AAA+ ATPase domain-containing protein n=1 Tax=Catenuloplanes nepalensis TaxID=587533 RepID=A0ABT9MTF2_9ACTN|nr:hypothetical protein [Catenuloplanes nepalensis]MDP9794722.1 hypothetical protein [Catenuloplanes nepalensis]
MPRGLTYADAVKILGGAGPLVTIADNVAGGALSLVTFGGSDVALSLFDAKNEVVRLGHLVSGKIGEVLGGLGRYDRNERLQAAHSVLVVSAAFAALDDCLAEGGAERAEFGRDEQVTLALRTPGDGDWPARLLAAEIPAPSADRGQERLLRDLEAWSAGLAARLAAHLSGLAVWDAADDRTRRTVLRLLEDQLPGATIRRYEESLRRLAAGVPEFDLWLRGLEFRAAARGLEALEAALLRATSHRDPRRQRAQLAAAYRAGLARPILGGDASDLVLPSLAAAYVNPRFRVRAAGPGARPADESWWDAAPRDDLATFLATHLTSPQAADAPLLLLGQPGAGKSSLTRILAARLPAADFLVVRVALREVPADAEIQDQIEAAVRSEIGESVSWPTLAADADGAMPVVLLDGLDELLQATGVQRSDYLARVAAFQQREAVLGRPVAVVVTSRVAVADRARVPAGSLAVRLEPFDEAQVERWLEIWNAANAGRLRVPLTPEVAGRFPDLAGQPLLLLMLALYDATASGAGLRRDDAGFDTGHLYEQLLREFAAREVGRLHRMPPRDVPGDLVEAELLRLSVVAFAMFHRLRLWVTAAELDEDLAGLGLGPIVAGAAEAFHRPVTAGQEMVGRFFFIQRAQAVQDDQRLQTYEFLHATFGEYLVARLVVAAVRDAAARSRARTLRLGPTDDDDLLQSLLGYTALVARANVIPFVTALVARHDIEDLRSWLIEQLRSAVTRPRYAERRYAPVDKRADYWMSTYSFNLLLLTLACGAPVRASELFRHAADPAAWLRDMARQWSAAVPDGMWLDTFATVTVTRDWAADERRDIVLTPESEKETVDWPRVDPRWSHRHAPSRQPVMFTNHFPLAPALESMTLTDALSDDALRHALEPLLTRMPHLVSRFVQHQDGTSESVAHSVLRLLVSSASGDEETRLLTAYERAVFAVTVRWGDLAPDPRVLSETLAELIQRLLDRDRGRLPDEAVRSMSDRLSAAGG